MIIPITIYISNNEFTKVMILLPERSVGNISVRKVFEILTLRVLTELNYITYTFQTNERVIVPHFRIHGVVWLNSPLVETEINDVRLTKSHVRTKEINGIYR